MTQDSESVVVPREEEAFLDQLRRVNTERYQAWVGDGQDAGILFDAAELGGEVGELLNVVKKLEREERGWRGSRAAPEDFADECADVLICLDKLARRRGVDLTAATIAKFNATSDKVGLPHRLSAAPSTSVREEAITAAIAKADEDFGYRFNLTRLVDGEETHTLFMDGFEPVEFDDRDDGYRLIAERRNKARATAVLAALVPSTDEGKRHG